MKNRIFIASISFAFALAGVFSSVSASAKGLIFQCTTSSEKIVRIDSAGSTISYSYGRPGSQPDLAFSVPRSSSSIKDGSENIGSGTWLIIHEISVRFSGTSYTAWWSFHRSSHEEEGGVIVSKGENVLARTACKSEADINLANY
jgi:hypothetical protein